MVTSAKIIVAFLPAVWTSKHQCFLGFFRCPTQRQRSFFDSSIRGIFEKSSPALQFGA